jgi:hypothetical protein
MALKFKRWRNSVLLLLEIVKASRRRNDDVKKEKKWERAACNGLTGLMTPIGSFNVCLSGCF